MAYKGNSIVDYLKSVGQDSSFSARKKLAEQNGISNYTGTASQNLNLLSTLRSGSSSKTASTNTTTNNTSANKNTATNANTANTGTPSTQASATNTVPLNGVSQGTYDAMTKPFETSDLYNQAVQTVQGQLDLINSGKTSWTDRINQIITDWENREKFSYNPDTDALFQNALQGAMTAGQSAMQDTIGQASALTGGYGSSYATSAANQAYNSFIEDAYDNLPDYYNMALNAYNMESENMLNTLNIYNQADQTEWGRLMDGYNVNYNNMNDIYNRDYQLWSDTVGNAFNMAGMENSDYWNQTNFDYQKERDAVDDAWRQKEWDFAQEQWNWTKSHSSSGGGGGSRGSGGSGGSSGGDSTEWRYANGDYIKGTQMDDIISGALAAHGTNGDDGLYAYVKRKNLDNATQQYVISVVDSMRDETVKQTAKTQLAQGGLGWVKFGN